MRDSLSSAPNSLTSARNSLCSVWHTHTKNRLSNSLSSLPETRRGPKNSLSSGLETQLSETVFGPSRTSGAPHIRTLHFFPWRPVERQTESSFTARRQKCTTYSEASKRGTAILCMAQKEWVIECHFMLCSVATCCDIYRKMSHYFLGRPHLLPSLLGFHRPMSHQIGPTGKRPMFPMLQRRLITFLVWCVVLRF